jgi:SAM-dependent methyltransferase
MKIANDKFFPAAFDEYLPTLQGLVAKYPQAKILELGGGRLPSFTLSQMPRNVADYTVNDIDERELALTSKDYDKACFDVTGDVSKFAGQFDVVFSRTLIEHVKDGRKMHRNVLSLLKPGGVAFHMAPTLYALPFLVNKWLPEDLSEKVLHLLHPNRRSEKSKFPAYYSWCFGNRGKMARMLRDIGYENASIRTFYGHGYFEKVPIVRDIDGALSALFARNDWSTFGSYAHIIATSGGNRR